MDKYTLQEEAYKRGYEAGLKAAFQPVEDDEEWVGKTILVRETPVEVRVLQRVGPAVHIEGYDAQGRLYLIPVSWVFPLEKPIVGVVRK